MQNPSQQISESSPLPALKHPSYQTRLKTEPSPIKDVYHYCHQQTNLIGESNLINKNKSLLQCKHTLAMSRIFNTRKNYAIEKKDATSNEKKDPTAETTVRLPILSRYEKLKTQGSDTYHQKHSRYHNSSRNILSSFQITQNHSPLKEIQQSKFKINPELVLGAQKLTNLGLKFNSILKTVAYAGHIKIPTVHNDYHSSKTNAGYSRSKIGGIYPK